MKPAKLFGRIAFYALVVAIVVFAVFPFYYAILTSLKSGQAMFEITYWPKNFDLRPPGKVFMKEYAKFIAHKNQMLGSAGKLDDVRKVV